jgi:hypothetical protein
MARVFLTYLAGSYNSLLNKGVRVETDFRSVYDKLASARRILKEVIKMGNCINEEFSEKVLDAENDTADAMHEVIKIEVERHWEAREGVE